jgi:hypothetical protein
LFKSSSAALPVAGLCLMLMGCATAVPDADSTPEPAAEQVVDAEPELNLNLSQQTPCHCTGHDDSTPDDTFLEKGYEALAGREYRDAVQYFQRYQRMESSPQADFEAAMALAYVKILPSSPYYNPGAALNTFRKLRKWNTDHMQLHPVTLLLRQSLYGFTLMDRQIADLEEDNAHLKEDKAHLKAELEKREAALKRLRELMVGQKGARS